jgi:exosortase E/protease (VPEID-CTERM system)
LKGPAVLSSRHGLQQRLCWLVVLLGVEWVAISATVGVPETGTGFGIPLTASAAFFLILGYSRVRASLPQISAELQSAEIDWACLLAHAGALLIFLALSFPTPAQKSSLLWKAPRLASAIGAIVLGIFALIPPPTAWRLILHTGRSWVYALAAGATAWRLSPFCQSLWNSSPGRVLTDVTFDFVHLLLRNVFPDVVADRAKLAIGTPRFAVEIGGPCSGFEGLGMILVFGVFWLWFLRKEIRFPQALLSLPAGLLLMWVLNAVRIVLLISIGHFGAEKIAIGGFHSQAGWIAFSGVTLAYAGALQHFRWFARVQSQPAATENRAAVFLVPFMAILAVSLLTHAASADFEWLYPLRWVGACCALWFFRRSYKALDWSLSWSGPTIGVAVFILWIALERFIHPLTSTAMPVALAGASAATRTAWILIRALAATTTVPIAEELAFRGFLLRRLMAEDFETIPLGRFTWPALLLSSITFGALHGSRWVAGTLSGLLYGFAVARRGKLGDAVIAHATTNAMLAAYVLVCNQWQFW